MRRLALLLGVLAVAACQHGGSLPAAKNALPDSAFVLPGAFSEQTTVADLQAQFGASNVKIGALPDGSDSGAVLFPDDPTRRAYVRFYDDAPLDHLASVTVNDPGSRWTGKLGVKVGTTFAELRERNGGKFWFAGFNARHEGNVRDKWNAGALDVAGSDALYFGVDLRLRDATPAGTYPSDDEQEVSSDDPRYPKLDEFVVVSAITAWSSLDDEW